MDGFGISKNKHGNAILGAKKPNIDYLMKKYPVTYLQASGEAVGLPEGQMGNSEVGHMNIGAGRIVYQSLTLINKSIKDGDFYQNPTFANAINHVKKNNSKLHIFGLLSDGGVHSHISHIFALLDLAKRNDVKEVLVHAFMDGRDVDPQTGVKFIADLVEECNKYGNAKLATISGRYYSMDRDKNLNRTDLAYKVITELKGPSFTDGIEYLKSEYARLESEGKSGSDEFVLPAYNANVAKTLDDGDAIIFANFRPDRAIQLATIITNPEFYANPVKKADGTLAHMPYTPNKVLHNVHLVCFMKYAEQVKGDIAFALKPLTNLLGPLLANHNYRQLRIAETEKYAHVTFFFDGTVNYDGKEKPELANCRRILINSPKIATYDLQPEMSAYDVTRALEAELDKNDLDVIILNYANCDMVGHTAIYDAVVKAVETVDECVGRIYNKVKKIGGIMLITADHGNAEMLLDETNHPYTAHTTNPVPFIVTDKSVTLRDGGILGDIAPTILELLGEEIPDEMEGKSLIKSINE
jgi:2,3-bisphosphoglycerate-independent phosphoglycerate mutase